MGLQASDHVYFSKPGGHTRMRSPKEAVPSVRAPGDHWEATVLDCMGNTVKTLDGKERV